VKRRLLNASAGISLLPLIATTALWVSSYYRYESPTYSRANGIFLQLTSWHGDLVFDLEKNWPDDCTGYYTALPSQEGIGPLFICYPGNYSSIGRFGFSYTSATSYVPTAKGRSLCYVHEKAAAELMNRADQWRPVRGGELSVPDAFVCGIFGLLPAIAGVATFQRRRWRLGGLCLQCGYDLRGTPERCPECGAMPAKKKWLPP